MRAKWTILLVFVLVVGGTALFTFQSTPVFEATSMVRVDAGPKSEAFPFLDLTPSRALTRITNELETLKAQSTLQAVARALLERSGKEMSIIRFATPTGWKEEGRTRRAEDTLAAVTLYLTKIMDFVPVKESDIIRITVRYRDAEEAATIADTYARVYLARNLSDSRVRSRSLREFLQAQVEAKRTELNSDEKALETYMRASGTASLDAAATKVVNQIAELEATRDGIEVDISSSRKSLSSLEDALRAQEPNIERSIGQSNDAYIRLLQEQLARLEVQRDVVIAQNLDLQGDRSYSEKLAEIDGQIGSLRKNLEARTKNYLNSVVPGDRSNGTQDGVAGFLSQVKQRIIEQQVGLDALNARKRVLNELLDEYEGQFNKIPKKSIELARFQRARVSSEKLYLMVEEKFNEAAITESSQFGDVNILDPAAVPLRPVSPRVGVNLAVGSFLGLLLGLGLVLVRNRLDDRIHAPEALKRRGYTWLGTVGAILTGSRKASTNSILSAKENQVESHLVSFHSPLSSVSEEYRQLRASILYRQPGQRLRLLMVTSPAPEEGKSTTVCNLAITFAHAESRVLLVDADMRKPSLHSLFGLPREPGLSNILAGRLAPGEAFQQSPVQGLNVLSSGSITPNPSEMLGGRRAREFVEFIKASYDVVLFDSPPLLAVTDAGILARFMDCVLLVVRAGRTKFGSLAHAVESLQNVGGTVNGVVLNNFDAKKAYGASHFRSDFQQYSIEYGYTVNGSRKSKSVG